MTALVSNEPLRATILALRRAGVSTYSMADRYGIPAHVTSRILYRNQRINARTYRRVAQSLGIEACA